MARLFGTLTGAKSSATRTGDAVIRARLATWHGAVVVTLDDHGSWTVHTEPADPQKAAAHVPRVLARGNVHTGDAPDSLTRRTCRPNRSPSRKPGPDWTPYTTEERSTAR